MVILKKEDCMSNIETTIYNPISYFQNISSQDLKQLSDSDRKILNTALAAIKNHSPCSNEALALIKRLANHEKVDSNLEVPTNRGRIQNLFNRRVSSSNLQKNINAVLQNELTEIRQTLKSQRLLLNKEQFEYIQKTCQDLQKIAQKLGSSPNEALTEEQRFIFVLIEKFSAAKNADVVSKSLNILQFFKQAFNSEDSSVNSKLIRVKDYQSDTEAIRPKTSLEFHQDEEVLIESGPNDPVLHLHFSDKALLVQNSPHFKSLLETNLFEEATQNTVTLDGVEKKDLTTLLELLQPDNRSLETLSLEEIVRLYKITYTYEFTKLIPAIEEKIVQRLRIFSPSDPEDLTRAISIYQVINRDSLKPEIEEAFGHFFANVWSKENSPLHKKTIIEVFNQIQLRELVFGDEHQKSDLVGVEQISSLSALKFIGNNFDDELFSYLKSLKEKNPTFYLTDLILENCNTMNLENLIEHKTLPFKNLSLQKKGLEWKTFKKLLSQADQGLQLKTIETRWIFFSYRPIFPEKISQIIFDVDPIKNNKLGKRIKCVNEEGKVEYEGGVIFEEGNPPRPLMDGEGKKVFLEGVYEGEFKMDKASGYGKMTYANGNIYEGKWENDMPQGPGKFTLKKSGEIYEGNWENRRLVLERKIINIEGDIYEGEIADGKENGIGQMIFANGDIYEGEWKNSTRHGKGRMNFANGNIYVGEWKDGKRDGQGQIIQANGNIYEGEFSGGIANGPGKLILKNGNIHEGNWKYDKLDLQGKRIYLKGDIYEGGITNGREHGKGKMVYANGDLYEGNWNYGYPHGIGKMIYANGDVYEGKWAHGEKIT